MSRRLSGIIHGHKTIQLYDLPIFTKLLDVTCEDILSAGKKALPVTNRLTNYMIAASKDATLWEQYMHTDESLILNYDEYGKNILDYIIKFKNYDLFRYLIDHHYIWLVDEACDNFARKNGGFSFAPGTSIKRRDLYTQEFLHVEFRDFHEDDHSRHTFSARVAETGFDNMINDVVKNDSYRRNSIILAIENDDIDMLTRLRAREVLLLHQANYYVNTFLDEQPYDKAMLEHIANASWQVLDYFTEEFEVPDAFGNNNPFMFPYIEILIQLLAKKNIDYLETVITRAIKHNENAYDKLKELLDKSIDFLGDSYPQLELTKDINLREKLMRDAAQNLSIKTVSNSSKQSIKNVSNSSKQSLIEWHIVSFRMIYRNPYDGIVTNIIRTDCETSSPRITKLLNELNASYERICAIKPQSTEK
ncbi:MAG: hypothetical protein IJ833_04920 [Lachnospiraceae bacterium]|nr:hypothetical protein [Lachnospiraceae bacterium]